MKFSLLLSFLFIICTNALASVTVNEFTLKRKVELSTRIVVAEVVGAVKNNDSQDEIDQYIQIKIINYIVGKKEGEVIKVVSDDGFPASNLDIDCIGGIYLFFLKDYLSFQEIHYQDEIFQPVNLKFSVYKVENGNVSNFIDGKSVKLSEAEKMILKMLKD